MPYSLTHLLQICKNPFLIRKLIFETRKILESLSQPIRIMEFCGGHTHSLLKYGIDELFKPVLEFLHGPGCPVCVLSLERLEMALEIARNKEVLFLSYGDLLRVPNARGESLLTLRALGFNVKMISNAMEVLTLAKGNPKKLVVFFAIGFETTAPATAFLLEQTKREKITNLKIISNHLLTPPVLDHLFSTSGVYVDGIIGPGHVSTIVGAKAYEIVAKKFGLPMVIAGFEPLDLLEAIYLLVKMILERRSGVEIAYKRVVTYEGNLKAQQLLKKVFEERDFSWRGLGKVPISGLALRSEYREWDGETLWKEPFIQEIYKGCICSKILQGKAKPTDCKLYGKNCTPHFPIGPCMVSSEGACLAYFKYKEAAL